MKRNPIKALLAGAGCTQTELSHILGTSLGTANKKVNDPGSMTVRELLVIFNVLNVGTDERTKILEELI